MLSSGKDITNKVFCLPEDWLNCPVFFQNEDMQTYAASVSLWTLSYVKQQLEMGSPRRWN